MLDTVKLTTRNAAVVGRHGKRRLEKHAWKQERIVNFSDSHFKHNRSQEMKTLSLGREKK